MKFQFQLTGFWAAVFAVIWAVSMITFFIMALRASTEATFLAILAYWMLTWFRYNDERIF